MDLVPITERQAKRLEAVGITAHVTYAVDRKLIDLIVSLDEKPKHKKAATKRRIIGSRASTDSQVFRVLKTDTGAANAHSNSYRGQALRIIAKSIHVGDIVDRRYLSKILCDGGLDTSVRPWLINELLRQGDIEPAAAKI